MSDRRAHLLYATVGICIAVGLSLLLDADTALFRSTGLWLGILVLVVLAAFLFEPQYSSGAAVTTNAAAVLLIFLSKGHSPHGDWWAALAGVAAATLFLTFMAYVLRDPQVSAAARPNRVARTLGQIAGAIGSWRALLIGTLALALVSFNKPFNAAWQVSVLTVIYCLLISTVEPHKLVSALRGQSPSPSKPVVVALFPPYEALVVGSGVHVGSLIRISCAAGSGLALVTAQLTHSGLQAWRVLAPGLLNILPASEPSNLVVDPDVTDLDAELDALRQELALPGVQILGTLTEGTMIRSSCVELLPGRQVELGDVVWTGTTDDRTYWQVADAALSRSSWSGDMRRVTQVTTSQVGQWDGADVAFEADVRSPRPADIVLGGNVQEPAMGALPPGLIRVGSLPKSPFPVVVDVALLSRTHGAILGTTGTGKTHLAFGLVEALQARGVSVICVDLTGQYATRFPTAVAANNANEVDAFLRGTDTLAVCTPAHASAILVANAVARKTYAWASEQGALDPGLPARCVIVFEEAQNFIPEAFVVNDWDLKAKAQDTSLVVMEARKFGLGFLLLSQRTAMITKSALSQCNSVFAFQAVDQTGLDYLEGLCGPALSRGIPTLPHRTAVVMGSALRSASPLIAYMDDAPVVIP